jgi:hypothetical protein
VPDDDAIWKLLTERARAGARPQQDGGPEATRFRRESKARLVSAAIDVLAAARTLVDVAEDVLRQYRDRLDEAPGELPTPPEHEEENEEAHERGPRTIHLTY